MHVMAHARGREQSRLKMLAVEVEQNHMPVRLALMARAATRGLRADGFCHAPFSNRL